MKLSKDFFGDSIREGQGPKWGPADQQRIQNQLLTMVVDQDQVIQPDGIRAYELRFGVPNDDPFLPPYSAAARVGEFLQRGSIFQGRRVFTDIPIMKLVFTENLPKLTGWVLLASAVEPGPWGSTSPKDSSTR